MGLLFKLSEGLKRPSLGGNRSEYFMRGDYKADRVPREKEKKTVLSYVSIEFPPSTKRPNQQEQQYIIEQGSGARAEGKDEKEEGLRAEESSYLLKAHF
jgi:hypothetical protein